MTAGIEDVLAAASDLVDAPSRVAFLDLTDPDLGRVSADLAACGERSAVVVPLLFTDAFHARVDVPVAVASAAEATGMDLRLAPILGTGDDVVEVVARRLELAGAFAAEPVLLYAVGSSRPEANAAVTDLARRLAAGREGAVEVGFGTTEPRAGDVLARLRRVHDSPGTVVPLFVAPGLLLDAAAPVVAEAGWRLAEPLGTLLARVVAYRFAAAVGDPRSLG